MEGKQVVTKVPSMGRRICKFFKDVSFEWYKK